MRNPGASLDEPLIHDSSFRTSRCCVRVFASISLFAGCMLAVFAFGQRTQHFAIDEPTIAQVHLPAVRSSPSMQQMRARHFMQPAKAWQPKQQVGAAGDGWLNGASAKESGRSVLESRPKFVNDLAKLMFASMMAATMQMQAPAMSQAADLAAKLTALDSQQAVFQSQLPPWQLAAKPMKPDPTPAPAPAPAAEPAPAPAFTASAASGAFQSQLAPWELAASGGRPAPVAKPAPAPAAKPAPAPAPVPVAKPAPAPVDLSSYLAPAPAPVAKPAPAPPPVAKPAPAPVAKPAPAPSKNQQQDSAEIDAAINSWIEQFGR
eukprot:gnl/TRDRNA2_/TRDRNA2_191555_c0_seq1.p1 gnl/TRDRNA2_/TRDRNA2_191555_c0~~gnl/TRDRNA2_/TRDRNA2_191555_c0_seq1.p1  ORF type:complete len:319 (-),score=71.58 gnl/TRDRNA2_/TRDRNA2_191555_c0_seq1:94-1050(-)